MKRTPLMAIAIVTAVIAALATTDSAWASSVGWTAHEAAAAPLLSVAVADPAHAWAVGPGPTIVATSDGGTAWVSQNPKTSDDLYAVAFADTTDGWAVGATGTVVATSDGGLDWATQTTPTAASLSGVACRGLDCWAVGTSGTIIATSDGGTTWLGQASPTGRDLYDVSFADRRHGWAVGDHGTILATTDAGAEWTTQSSPTSDYLNGVTCRDALHAWAVGERGVIIATSDGGLHWLVRRAAKSHDLYTVAFADRRHGWAVGVGGLILATTDGGASWRVQPSPTTQDLTAVAFADPLHGFVADMTGTMLTTAHAGWSDARPPTTVALGAAGWHRRPVRVVLRASDGAGGSGVAFIRYSLNAGKTWTRGSSFLVAAPADHSDDGTHTFLYRATDNAGNLEAARRGWLGIDTRRPTPVAKWPATATRGARCALRFYVSDRRPGSPTATVTIRIVNARDGLVKKTVLRSMRVDRTCDWVFTCWLPAGAYHFTVAATDAAGNRGTRAAVNTLVVRRGGCT